MDPKQFGAFLCEERKAKKLTQKELAEKLGVTDKAISKWERGVCLPDVAKFDDIAAALDITDVEVLRAKRLPPEEAKAEEKAPPFVTWRELGQLLLGWAIVMAALFAWDMLEIARVVPTEALGLLLRPLASCALAIWLALRHARGVKRTDWRGVSIYGAVFAALFILYVFLARLYGMFWPSMLFERVYGINIFEEDEYFRFSGIHWEPRWLIYWFLVLSFFDLPCCEGIALAGVAYPVTKLLRIWRNAKRQTNG